MADVQPVATLYTLLVGNLSHWSQALGALFIGVVGLWVAHSYRRQVKVKLAERLADSYSALWELTRAASTNRRNLQAAEDRAEMDQLMESWYFDNGNGLLMSKPSRILFFHIKKNLIAPLPDVVPESLAERLSRLDPEQAESARACACNRQFSMLRTQLKDDLAIYRGKSHQRHRRKDERDLLKMCGIGRGRIALRRSKRPTPCQCGTCPGAHSWSDRFTAIAGSARSREAKATT